jgi:hypothetical protein
VATLDVAVDVRQVTADEQRSYWDNGWVSLPGLIAPELADELLERARRLMGESGYEADLREIDRDLSLFAEFDRVDRSDDLYRSLVFHPKLGRNAALLLGRDMAVRSLMNMLAVKLPKDSATDRLGKGPTDFHQDFGSLPLRAESIVIWIALAEITPEMGSVRFHEGSHKLGRLAGNPLEWPRLEECPLSEPLHMQPGDATGHSPFVVHGAPENTTDRPRWAYIASYFPAHATYTGATCHHTDKAEGLVPDQPLDHPSFPVVYDPERDRLG